MEAHRIEKKVIRVIVPIIIVVLIAGIFVYKRTIKNSNANQQDSTIKDSIPLEISSVDLEGIFSYGLPVVIDFGSDSCIPCKQMAPVLETLNEEWQGEAIVHFVDVWKNATAADGFPISVIPTQVYYNAEGTPFVPSDELSKEIEFTMYSSKDTKEHLFTVHQGGVTEIQMRRIFAEMGVE